MSEQLALQQGLRNGRAVDSYEWRSVVTPGVVEQPRDHLLAGAIFSLNQDAPILELPLHQFRLEDLPGRAFRDLLKNGYLAG
ncbi:MAG: hypothetical protein AAB222_10580, partial [Candidatus Binatota bacterium]